MGRFKGLKRFGRRVGRHVIAANRRGKRILGKVAGTAHTILGRVDKLTGGAATQALSKHPYGRAALAAITITDAALN